MFVSIISLAFFAVFAVAQSSSSTTDSAAQPSGSLPAGISPCIISCVAPAATKNGCVFTDAPCVCASAQFQEDARECLMANCTSNDVQSALGLQAQQCGAIGVSATGTFTTGSAAATGSATTAASNSSTPSGPGSTAASTTAPGSSTMTGPTSTGASSASNTISTGAPSSPSPTSAAMKLGNSMGFAGAVLLGVLGCIL